MAIINTSGVTKTNFLILSFLILVLNGMLIFEIWKFSESVFDFESLYNDWSVPIQRLLSSSFSVIVQTLCFLAFLVLFSLR